MSHLLSRRLDWYGGRHLTFGRDLKEAYCYVAPPNVNGRRLAARIAAGEDVQVEPVRVEAPDTINGQRHHFELQNERVLVPELLFDHEASDDNPTLPELVVNCGAAALAGGHCDAECARLLFR